MCTHPPQEPRKTPQLLIVATDVSHGGHHLQWYERKQVVIGQGVQAGSVRLPAPGGYAWCSWVAKIL